MIETDRLIILPCALEHFEALEKGREHLAHLVEARVPKSWPNFPEAILYFHEPLKVDPELAGWGTWLVVEKTDRVLIGEGGYGGKPSADGRVEIGYAIIPEYRRRGYAAEFARALVGRAFADPRVKRVEAGTLLEGEHAEASAAVLEKLGLRPEVETAESRRWCLDRAGWSDPARTREK